VERFHGVESDILPCAQCFKQNAGCWGQLFAACLWGSCQGHGSTVLATSPGCMAFTLAVSWALGLEVLCNFANTSPVRESRVSEVCIQLGLDEAYFGSFIIVFLQLGQWRSPESKLLTSCCFALKNHPITDNITSILLKFSAGFDVM